MKTKCCAKCKLKKLVCEFYKCKRTFDRYSSWCKDCSDEYSKNWYLTNKQRLLKNTRNYQEKNKELIRKRSKIYYINNKEIIIKKRAIYLYKTKNYRSKKGKEYYQKHKHEVLNRTKKYRQIKYKNDINFRIKNNLRSRLYAALNGKTKSKRTLELLGCSIKFLKKYLEKSFKIGMSWENYGAGENGKGMQEWHIDHITPCAKFDLSQSEEQRKCFHYTNLQPLWADINRKKNKF